MIKWSLKLLLYEWVTVLASLHGIAFSFLLMMFFSAVFSGESERIVAYPQKVNADAWVMQKGVSNMHMAISQVWDWKEDRVRALQQVDEVESILYLNAIVNAGERNWFSYIVGLKKRAKHSAPWEMHSGKRVPEAGEVVIPEVMSRLTGLNIGHELMIVDRKFKIAGLSRHTFSMANSIVFVSYSDLAEIMSSQGSISYLMVWAKPGVSVDQLKTAIHNQLDKVSVVSQDEFVQNDYQMAMQMGVEVTVMMSIISSVLAVVIAGYTCSLLIKRHAGNFAIVRALGFKHTDIYISVIFQAVVVTFSGLLLSILFAALLFPLINYFVPAVTLIVRAETVINMFTMAIIIAVFSVIWPARQVTRIDPMKVFYS